MKKINKLCIVGLGLIGGSIGLAARKRKLAREVCGLVRRPESVREARRRGVVDFATLDPVKALAGADMVVIAVTLGATEQIARQIQTHLPEGCIVTDVGSCKQRVIERTQKALGSGVRFVGVHPIAGSEQSGMSAAVADLFDGAPCILTPVRGTDPAALKQVTAFWKALGSRVNVMSPGEHDRIAAAISHLPHFLAVSLVNASVGMLGDEKTVLDYAGSGFRDTTRVAASGAEMWADIAADNAGEMLRAVTALEKQLSALKKALRGKDGDAARALLTRASAVRRKLNAG